MGLVIGQMDVKTAFLSGKVGLKVSVHRPVGYEDGTNQYPKIMKDLYSLKASPTV